LSQKVVVSVVFVLAMFMAIMDITIVNVALPTLGRDFGVAATDVGVVSVGFLVSLAVFIPASGWLGDRLGTKRVLLIAIAIFTVASALCGTAQSVTELVVFRVLQGVGGGMLTPVGMAMLYRAYPPEERVRASRILTVPTAFAPALGPVLGGLLITDLSWRWVFWVNVPVGIAAFLFGLVRLEEHREPDPGRFDLRGFALAGIGFAALMYAVSEGPATGWSSPLILVTGFAGLLLVAGMVWFELRVPQPMVALRLVRDHLFGTTLAVIFPSTMAFLGVLYAVSLFFQDGLSVSPLVSGLSTFPEAIGIMIGAQSAGRLYPHVGPRHIIAGGAAGIAVVTASMSLVGAGGDALWLMRVLMFFLGLAVAHVFVPSQAAAFATITPAATGRASTLFNAMRQLGSAVGISVITSALSLVGTTRAAGTGVVPDLGAYHVAFLVAAGTALLAIAPALRIRDSDAASTMVSTGGKAGGHAGDAVPGTLVAV
jgi:EmrB/QacA subfamily drug resistance transporter